MRGANILIMLLAAGILLFGCCSTTTPQQEQSAGTGTPQADGGQGTGQAGTGDTQGMSGESDEAGTDDSGAGDSGTSDTGSSETGGETGQGDDYSGKDFETLAGLGVPLVCDMTVTNDGKTVTVKLYMKGSSEMRMDVQNPSGEPCDPTVTIVKGDTTYIGCGGGIYMLDCNWLSLRASDYEGSGGASGTSAPPDPSDVPPADLECAPWIYDASKLATSGKVCTMDDLMQGYQQDGYPDGYD